MTKARVILEVWNASAKAYEQQITREFDLGSDTLELNITRSAMVFCDVDHGRRRRRQEEAPDGPT